MIAASSAAGPTPAPAHPGAAGGRDPFASAARLDDAVLAGDPAGYYRMLRQRHGPVAPILLEGGLRAWLVLGYREVHYVTSNSDLFARDSRRWNQRDLLPADSPLQTIVGWVPSIVFTEGAEHQRRAGAIQEALAGVDQFDLRTRVERLADGLIDSFAGAGAADLIASYAVPIPLLTCAAMFGFTESQTSALLDNVATIVNGSPDAVAAYEAMARRTREILEDRQRAARADVPTRLVTHPANLDLEEMVADLIALTGIGASPTANWIGNTLALMLTDDRFAVTLAGNRRSVGQALSEVLWEDPPFANYANRWAARGTQLGGQHIRAGDMLVLSYAAANTDPALWPDAHAGPGGNNAHMAFSHGEHRCPYAAQEIAEVIAQTAIEVLLDRLPDVALAVEPAELSWLPSLWVRGLTALPVTFSPA